MSCLSCGKMDDIGILIGASRDKIGEHLKTTSLKYILKEI